jgi:DNA-binding LytR/AlgR family response regulator
VGKKKKVPEKPWFPGINEDRIKSYDDIIYIEADINYYKIHHKDGSLITVTECLKYAAERLSRDMVYRTHKHYIVNYKYVKSWEKKKCVLYVTLTNGDEIKVTKREICQFFRHYKCFLSRTKDT